MSCPLCGGAVVYQGLSSIECDGPGCTNGPPNEWISTVVQGYSLIGKAPVFWYIWEHHTGAMVSALGDPKDRYFYYVLLKVKICADNNLTLHPSGSAKTLEEAQRLALGGGQ